jgi:hypothetical protein
MVVPDRDVVPVQLAEARKRAEGVGVVVEDRDPHRAPTAARPRAVSRNVRLAGDTSIKDDLNQAAIERILPDGPPAPASEADDR